MQALSLPHAPPLCTPSSSFDFMGVARIKPLFFSSTSIVNQETTEEDKDHLAYKWETLVPISSLIQSFTELPSPILLVCPDTQHNTGGDVERLLYHEM